MNLSAWKDRLDAGKYDAPLAALYGAADELTPQLLQGGVDIAAVPLNLASVLYNKTSGGVKLCAVGVLGVLPGLVGCIQAAEVLKMLLGTGGMLKGRMLFIDALQMRFEEMELPANPRCPLCGGGLRR